MRPHLTPRERQVLVTLEGGGIVSGAELVRALYGTEPSRFELDCIKSFVYRLRRKGYAILNVRGVGYALGGADRCPTCGRELGESPS